MTRLIRCECGDRREYRRSRAAARAARRHRCTEPVPNPNTNPHEGSY